MSLCTVVGLTVKPAVRTGTLEYVYVVLGLLAYCRVLVTARRPPLLPCPAAAAAALHAHAQPPSAQPHPQAAADIAPAADIAKFIV
jgi:hypothetical protein